MSAIKGYKSAFSQVMSARGIDISHDKDLTSLIKSFSIERPVSQRDVPRWDIMVVMRHLMKPPYEPMNMSSLANLTRKTAFLIMLATAKRNSEIWTFSADVSFGTKYESVTLKFLPGFIAKTHKPGVPDTELQPVTFPALGPTLSAYAVVTDEDVPFLTYRNFQAREVRALATSLAFHQHFSVAQVMKAAAWRASGTFASFYLRDISPSDLVANLGNFVAGQTLVSDVSAPVGSDP